MNASIERMALAQQAQETAEKKETKASASTLLVEIALEQYELGISTTGDSFAIPTSGPKIVRLLRGSRSSLRAAMAREFFSRYGKATSQQALADAGMVLEGLAQDSDEQELHLRVGAGLAGVAGHEYGQYKDDLWLDMGDQTGRAIHITPSGWTVEADPPMLFKRTVLMGALPDPERGGSLEKLFDFLNVETPDRPLLVAWLVAALFPDIPHPILCFNGEQGTGKTTAQKIVVSVMDPGPVPTRKPPRDADSWVTAAAGSWLVGLDNLSTVPDWLSDSLCRAVTGDGDVRRKLYTDGEHAVFAFRRCICLTSIDLGAVRGDLGERMLPIGLDIIPDTERMLESDIWPAWEQAHPRILGAVLDLCAGVMAALPFVELRSKPRMADFARIVAAVDKVLGTEGLAHYLTKQTSMAADSLDGDNFITALAKIDTFNGTAAELLDKITPDKPPKGWPANARSVTQRLRRQAPVMRKAGWRVTDDGGQNHQKVVEWTLTRPEIARISYPRDPHTRKNDSERGSAGVAGQEYATSQDESEVDL